MQQTQNTAPHDNTHLILSVSIALLFAGGVTFLVFAAAYAQDISALLNAPEIIWDFLCGAPNPDGPILPLLLTLGTMGLLGGAVLTAIQLIHSRRTRHKS